MTRNSLLKILAATCAGLYGGRIQAQAEKNISTTKPKVMFNLDDFGGIQIRKGDESVEITCDEIWEALQPPNTK